MEWLRAKLQDSEQARGSGGARLGAPAGSVWGPSDADWLSAARIGRRRRNAAGDALAEATVRPTPMLLRVMRTPACFASHFGQSSMASAPR